MDAMIELQKQLDTFLTELIEQERVTANHIRIVGHATEGDKNNTARIRYQSLALIKTAFDQGQQSYCETMLRYRSPVEEVAKKSTLLATAEISKKEIVHIAEGDVIFGRSTL